MTAVAALFSSPPEVELRQHTPRQDIQGMRGVAVLLVVLFHAGLPVPGGFVGVDVFFVISGFVITGLLTRELTRSGTVSFRTFYARRIRRLLPALTLVVFLTLCASFMLGSPFDGQQRTTALTGAGALLMVANYVIFLNSGAYFATPPTNNPLLNTWSLSVEEQFYLIFPALLLLLWLLARRRRSSGTRGTLLAGIGVTGLLSLALCIGMTYGVINYRLTDPDWFAFYSSPTRAWEFAAGAMVFLLLGSHTSLPRPALGNVLVVAGVAGVFASAFLITEASIFPGYLALAPVLATCLMLAGGSLGGPLARPLLGNAPMARLGDVSYSWYLWHWPLIAFTVMLVDDSPAARLAAAVIALLLSEATLRWLENPIRFSTRFTGWRVVALAAGCVAIVLVASSALYVGSARSWGSASLQSMNEQVSAKHLWQVHDCNTSVPLGQRGSECTWHASASGAPIYLVGDSMAGMLSEAAVGAGEVLGRPVLLGTKGACPFIDATLALDGRVDEACAAFVQRSLDWLVTQPPGDVILSSSLGYTTMGGATLTPPLGQVAQTIEDKTDLYLSGLGSVVSSLTEAGHDVHVVLPTPGYPRTLNAGTFWYPSQCATYEALLDTPGCGTSRSELDVAAETAELDERIATTVRGNGGQTIQLRGQLCRDGMCATNYEDEWAYLDGTHISVRMSQALTQVLTSSLT